MFSFSVLTGKKNLRKLFGRLVKSLLVVSTVTFWGRLFFWMFFSAILKTNFMPHGKRNSAKLSKLLSTGPDDQFSR